MESWGGGFFAACAGTTASDATASAKVATALYPDLIRASALQEEGEPAPDDGEDIEVLELPFADALAMTLDGRIADAKTIILLQWAALHGPFAGPRAG